MLLKWDYGLYAKYDANNLGLGAAYQRDGNGGKGWGVGRFLHVRS